MNLLDRIFHRRAATVPLGHPSTLSGFYNTTSVTPDSALAVSSVFACVKVVAESVASLPLKVYRRTANGKDAAPNHSLYPILHELPNSELTSFELREMLMGHVLLRGNAYCEIEMNGRGDVIGLWPLQPNRVTVSRAPDGKLIYTIDVPGQGSIALPQDRVWHIRGFSTSGLIGQSPVSIARNAISVAIAGDDAAASLAGNAANPGGVLTYPGKLSDEAYKNVLDSWQNRHQGLGKAGRTALLEQGMDYKTIGMSLADQQFLETRKFQRSEVASLFRVPPHMIGDLERATFCLPAGTDVFTAYGPKPIELVERGEVVWSRNERGEWQKSLVSHATCSGVDEILCIKTTNRTIRANRKHRILVRRKYPDPRPGQGGYQNLKWVDEYVPAGDLKAGDTIIAMDGGFATGTDQAPTRKASLGFMAFCGLLLGDGNINQGHGVTIARANNAPHMDYYREVMRTEFVRLNGGNGRGDRSQIATAPVTLSEGDRQTRFSSVIAAEELTKLGLAGTARTKQVPGWVFEMSEAHRLAFLKGFVDSDGHVDKKGRISVSSCNRDLLSGIRHLCMMSGIPVTNLRCQKGTTTLPNGKKAQLEQWTFTCSDPASNQKIGSANPSDLERLTNGKPFSRKGRNYPRFGGEGEPLNGASLSRITSITIQPAENVYDLEVEGTHNFVADGVIVHNSNIEHQSIDFVVHTLRPWLVRIEQSIARDLIGPLERSRIFAQFNVDGLLRGDIKSRYEAYHVARNDGWLSANDIRHLEDLNSVDNGDAYWQPVNMADASNTQQQAPTWQRAFTIAMRDAMTRILRRELQDVGRKTNVDMQKFEADHRQFVAKTLEPVVRSFAVMLGKEEIVDDYIKSATEARLDAIYRNKIDEAWLETIDATVASEVARLESLWT